MRSCFWSTFNGFETKRAPRLHREHPAHRAIRATERAREGGGDPPRADHLGGGLVLGADVVTPHLAQRELVIDEILVEVDREVARPATAVLVSTPSRSASGPCSLSSVASTKRPLTRMFTPFHAV